MQAMLRQQVTYRWWRFSIKAFWWLVIIYSMVVLCLIYTYQFEHVPAFWMNVTGLQDTTSVRHLFFAVLLNSLSCIFFLTVGSDDFRMCVQVE